VCTWTHKLNRFLTLLRAYLGASLAAGFVIALAIMLAILVGLLVNGRWSEAPLTILTLLIGWGFASLYVAVLALPPAVLVVAFAEAVREQRASFYGWAGVATAGVSTTTLVLLASSNLSSWPVDQAILAAIFAIVLALAGLVGGRVFRNLAAPKAGEGCGAITQS